MKMGGQAARMKPSPDDLTWEFFLSLPVLAPAGEAEGTHLFLSLALSHHTRYSVTDINKGIAAAAAAAGTPLLPTERSDLVFAAVRCAIRVLNASACASANASATPAVVIDACIALQKLLHGVGFPGDNGAAAATQFLIGDPSGPAALARCLRGFPAHAQVQLAVCRVMMTFFSCSPRAEGAACQAVADAALASAELLAERVWSPASGRLPAEFARAVDSKEELRAAIHEQILLAHTIIARRDKAAPNEAAPGQAAAAARLLRLLVEKPRPDRTSSFVEIRSCAALAAPLLCSTLASEAAETNRRAFIQAGGLRLLVRALRALAQRQPDGESWRISAQESVLVTLTATMDRPLPGDRSAWAQLAVGDGAVALLVQIVLAPPSGVSCGANGAGGRGSAAVAGAGPLPHPSAVREGAGPPPAQAYPREKQEGEDDGHSFGARDLAWTILLSLNARLRAEAFESLPQPTADSLLSAACRQIVSSKGCLAADVEPRRKSHYFLLVATLLSPAAITGPAAARRAGLAVESGAVDSACEARSRFALPGGSPGTSSPAPLMKRSTHVMRRRVVRNPLTCSLVRWCRPRSRLHAGIRRGSAALRQRYESLRSPVPACLHLCG